MQGHASPLLGVLEKRATCTAILLPQGSGGTFSKELKGQVGWNLETGLVSLGPEVLRKYQLVLVCYSVIL